MAESRAERIGFTVYADILRMIANRPTNAHEIEESTGWSRRPILRFLRMLERMELAHVSAWNKPPDSRCWVECFTLGPGVRAPKPTTRGEHGGRLHLQDKRYRPQALAIGNLLRALSEGATRSELVERSGICLRSMGKLIPYMHDRPKLIHIAEWRRRQGWGGPPEPIFMLGNLKDTPRPEPLGADVANKRYRVKRAARRGETIGYSVFSIHAGASLLTLA